MNDYFSIDEEYGTMEDLVELVVTAHEFNMKVLLDLVYSHIGPNAPIIKRYPDFVKQTADGKMLYTEWIFPALDYRNDGLREFMYRNMTYYIGVIDVDGIPMVYCGNELACCANLNMFANRFHMGKYEVSDRKKNTDEVVKRKNILKKLNEQKKENDVLRFGKTRWLNNADADNFISFKRTYKLDNILFVGNTSNESKCVKIDEVLNDEAVILENGLVSYANGELLLKGKGYAVLSYTGKM